MRPLERTAWQPRLLLELRRVGKLAVAVDFAGTTLKTVRRHVIRDADRLGSGHPDSLGALILAAKLAHAADVKAARLRGMARRRAAVEAGAAERRTERARAAAEARWGGRHGE